MAEESNCKDHEYANINAPVINIAHQDMERYCEESIFRIICPVCKVGLLLVGRNQKTFELLEYDNCVLCGQKVKYTDIDDLRKIEGVLDF